MRVRNTKRVRQMLRIEHPYSGSGVYSHMWVDGAGSRSSHPARWCPAPYEDGPLMRQVTEFLGICMDSKPWASEVWEIFARQKEQWEGYGRWSPGSYSVFDGPGPYEEGCPWIFGVPNMRTLKAWFSQNSRRRAHNLGLVVSVYEAHPTAVMVGETQAIMYGPASKRVAMFSVPE